ncbi:MAG TPA: metallophosphoesterase family protein [Beutenbergiaceae bacterium]|nr:metallophosphoesterase family protein [Beutenbergiaceae bacterium]
MNHIRVPPYLHAPSSTGMTIIWFSHAREPGTLTVSGPGAPGPITSTPEDLQELQYSAAERAERIRGLPPGSWLAAGLNVRHRVVLEGLRPGTEYSYSVTQGERQERASFRTAPTADDWTHLRVIAWADSETAPAGRFRRRSWLPGSGGEHRPDPGGIWQEKFGVNVRPGPEGRQRPVLRYPLTEGQGYRAVVDLAAQDEPDLLLHPGDLVAGGGYQPAWDEYFAVTSRHGLLATTPLLPAMGNWENFGALNGGYGTAQDRGPVVRARAKYHAYFPGPDGTPPAAPGETSSGWQGVTPPTGQGATPPAAPRGFYRVDYGPLTILTLDSSNGEPDDQPSNYPQPLQGREYRGPGTDTQQHFTRTEYERSGGKDLSDIHPGGAQWRWVEENLREARSEGRIIVVQFHHIPYSSGTHGLPMDHALTTGQGGTPMRRFHPLFRNYGVAAVICGHSELFERSVVGHDASGADYDSSVLTRDESGADHDSSVALDTGDDARSPAGRSDTGSQAAGVLYYDVGIAGDSLGGELRTESGQLLRYNPYRVWTADQDEPEQWRLAANGNSVLHSGGKHYGYLCIDLRRTAGGARMRFEPVHAFPVMDETYRVVRIQRRSYSDVVELAIGPDGRPG